MVKSGGNSQEKTVLHDYELIVPDGDGQKVHAVRNKLRDIQRGGNTFQTEFIRDRDGRPVGANIVGTRFTIDYFRGTFDGLKLLEGTYELRELSRDPSELRQQLGEARAQVTTLEKKLTSAEGRVEQAQEELGEWMETYDGYEGDRAKLTTVLETMAGILGEELDPEVVTDENKLLDYLARFTERVEEGAGDKKGPDVIYRNEYVAEKNAVTLLFSLDKDASDYEMRLEACTHKLAAEMEARTFKGFDNFKRRDDGKGPIYHSATLRKMLLGEEEIISGSNGESRTVTCHYVVPVSGLSSAEFFPQGGYTIEDAMAKYGLSKMKLVRNSGNSGAKLEKKVLEGRDGNKIIMYRRDQLDETFAGK